MAGYELVVLYDRFPAMRAGFRTAVMNAVAETCSEIEQDVKSGKWGHAAPYRTGNLRRSYHVDLFPDELRGEVGNDPGIAPYAPFVELGTRFMAPRPHLVPAAEYQREPLLQRIDRNLRALAAGS